MPNRVRRTTVIRTAPLKSEPSPRATHQGVGRSTNDGHPPSKPRRVHVGSAVGNRLKAVSGVSAVGATGDRRRRSIATGAVRHPGQGPIEYQADVTSAPRGPRLYRDFRRLLHRPGERVRRRRTACLSTWSGRSATRRYRAFSLGEVWNLRHLSVGRRTAGTRIHRPDGRSPPRVSMPLRPEAMCARGREAKQATFQQQRRIERCDRT